MAYQLTASNYDTECGVTRGDGDKYPAIKFVCTLNGEHLFTMCPEAGRDAEAWMSLAARAKTGGSDHIDWQPSNGKSYISVSKLTAAFSIAKYGDGRGGNLIITVPAASCVDAFMTAAQLTNDW